MPTGLKRTSSTVAIGFSVAETAPNTFAQTQIDLNLSPLDREVFVVQAIDLTLQSPDGIAATDTASAGSLTTTRQIAVAEIVSFQLGEGHICDIGRGESIVC